MTAYTLAKKLRSFELTKEIALAIKMSKPKMANLNRAQLRAGRNSLGKRIRPKYKTKRYATKKADMNNLPGTGNPDLLFKGDFHAGIDVKVTNKTYSIFSRDKKAGLLQAKYPDILGLTKDSIGKYSKETLMPILQYKLKSKLR